VLRGINDELEGNFHFVGNVFAADFILTEAKGSALSSGRWAFTPADGTSTISAVIALGVAQSSALYLILVALKGSASCATVRVLGAGDANICHTLGAVGRAYAAADIMEALMASWVPKGSPLFTAMQLVDLACTSAIGIGLVAISTIVTELLIAGAVLPADGADTREASFTVGVAKSTILLLVLGARRKRLSSSAAISLLPARVGNISVMVVVMEVMDGSSIVIFLSVSQRLFRVMSEMRHMLFILVV